MAGGSGSFFKNCKSEKVEHVRGRQEGSRKEKERRIETGVMESGMYFFENLFLNIYLC